MASVPSTPRVSVVDDDESIREGLANVLRSFGFRAEVFTSAEEFLAAGAADRTACLILDVSMPGMSGPGLQLELAHRGEPIPIVFITARGGELVGPGLVARGAVACLRKPFSETALLDALRIGLGTR